MAGAGYKAWAPGDRLDALDVNKYLSDQVVQVYATATARDTALSGVLAEGMLVYLKSTQAVTVYDGSAWLPLATFSLPVVPLTSGGTGGTTSPTAKAGIGIFVTASTPTALATGDLWIY